MSVRKKYKLQQLAVTLLLGIAFGSMAYFSTEDYLKKVVLEYGEKYYRYTDFFNVLFYRDEFKQFPYIKKVNISLIQIAISFFIPAVFIGAWKYAKEPATYYGMLAVRSDTMYSLVEKIRGSLFSQFATYTAGYFMAILVWLGYYKPNGAVLPDICKNTGAILLAFWFSRSLFLTLIGKIIFQIHIRMGIGLGIFFGCIFMMFGFMLDVQISGINYMLYHVDNYFFDSILISIVGLGILEIVERKERLKIQN